jgi:transposase-like protein
MGRPSKYNAEFVLDAMVVDGSTVTEACRAVGLKRSTFNGCVRADRDGLTARYMRAQRIQIDCMHDDMMDINEHQRKEAAKRLRQGESARAVARTYNVHHATVSRLREYPRSRGA